MFMGVYKLNTGGWGLRLPYVYVGRGPIKKRLGTTDVGHWCSISVNVIVYVEINIEPNE